MQSSYNPLTPCPAPMTRAALITLRNTNSLSKDCDYVITDHVQGRLVAGTTIHLQAVDTNTLSEVVSVKTPYDNVAWSGIYDIDAGQVTFLQDNLSNTVRGAIPVTDFDWGNTALKHCSILGAIMNYTYGNTASIQYLYVEGAQLDLTGFAGTIRKLQITGDTNVNLVGSRLRFADCDFSGNSTVNFSNTTATTLIIGLAISGHSFVNFASSTLPITIDGMSVHYSNIQASSVTTGSFTANGFILANGILNLTTGMNAFTAIRSSLRDNAVITSAAGSILLSGCEVITNASVSTSAGNTSLSLQSAKISTRSLVNSNGAGSLSIVRANIDANSLIQTITGSTSSPKYI
jgi:hypothetical protein